MRSLSLARSFALVLIAGTSSAQTTTWTGNASTSWSNPVNWTQGVPTAGISAVIGTGMFLPRVTTAASAVCAHLTLSAGAILTVAANASLTVAGTMTVGAGATLLCGGGTTRVVGSIATFGNIALNSGHVLEYGGNFDVHSSITGDGKLKDVGTTQALTAFNGATIPNLEGGGPMGSSVTLRDVHVRLGVVNDQVANTFVIRGVCEIDGDCFIGPFAGDADATLHVHGDLRVPGNPSGAAELPPGLIIVDGDLTFPNTYNFDPQRGSIVLNGTGPQLIVPEINTQPFDVVVAPGAQVTVSAPGPHQIQQISTLYVQGSLDFLTDVSSTAPLAQTIVVTPTGHLGYSPSLASIPPPGPLEADLVHVEGTLSTAGMGLDIGTLNVTATGAVTLGANDHLVLGDVTVAAGGALSIASGGELDLYGTGTVRGRVDGAVRVTGQYAFENVTVPGYAVEVDNALSIVNGAYLDLGTGGSLHVGPGAGLALVGTPTDRASVFGANASILLEGALFAQLYEFAGMSSAGVRITSTAIIGAAPNDLRGGLFRGGQNNGTQLDLARTAPTTLRELDFEAGGTTVAKNVRVTSGAAITIVDSLGDHAGSAFEVDPGNRVSWLGPGTTATSLVAHPRTNRNLLAFATTQEDTTSFRFVRDTVPSSTQVALAAIPALGAPRSYQHVDNALLAGTTYSYELQRLSPYTGAWRRLGTIARARPHAALFGPTACVGPNGFTTIQAALAAVATGGTVFVEAGDYGGFTITRAVRVLGDPLGGTRIVGAVPVVAQNLAAGSTVVLDALEVRDAQVRLLNLADTAILHEVAITGTGTPGLVIDTCPEVALQEVTTTRRADVTRSTLAIQASSLGTVNLVTNTQATHVETTATFAPDASSSAIARAGTAARLAAPTLFPVLVPQQFTVTGTAGHSYTVFIGLGHDFLDLSALVPIDMRLLVSLTPGLWTLASGTLGPGGGGTFTVTAPDNVSSYGTNWTLQAVTFALPAGGRFGEVADFVIVP